MSPRSLVPLSLPLAPLTASTATPAAPADIAVFDPALVHGEADQDWYVFGAGDENVAAGGQFVSGDNLAYRAYGPYGSPGQFQLRIDQLQWTDDGWPELS